VAKLGEGNLSSTDRTSNSRSPTRSVYDSPSPLPGCPFLLPVALPKPRADPTPICSPTHSPTTATPPLTSLPPPQASRTPPRPWGAAGQASGGNPQTAKGSVASPDTLARVVPSTAIAPPQLTEWLRTTSNPYLSPKQTPCIGACEEHGKRGRYLA